MVFIDDLANEGLKDSKGEKGQLTSFEGFTLSSAFHPIISIPHRRAVGYEALIRAKDEKGKPCSPLSLFSLPRSSVDVLALDRTCRQLHINNFSGQETVDEWLFINLDAQGIESERPAMGFMLDLLARYELPPQRIVIEILEHEIDDREYLKGLIKHFREMGCLIAIDDFGAGHSNFERIWDLEPDIVKLDKSLVSRAANSSKVKRILSGMVSLIHETGCLVVIEGVETKGEALIAIDVDADMVQGFYFALPDAMINSNLELDTTFTELVQLQRFQARKETQQLDYCFNWFHELFEKAMCVLVENKSLDQAADIIFREERAIRCFLLDEVGYQKGSTIHAKPYERQFDKRVLPLLSGKNASWSHKYYHFRAINQPDKLQVTRPYLSVAGLQMCITVSKAFELEGNVFVFCCDLYWQDN